MRSAALTDGGDVFGPGQVSPHVLDSRLDLPLRAPLVHTAPRASKPQRHHPLRAAPRDERIDRWLVEPCEGEEGELGERGCAGGQLVGGDGGGHKAAEVSPSLGS